jgi:hypothetical protein
MRPTFVDTFVTEAGIDLGRPAEDPRPGRSESYREWRRTRVLFMRSPWDEDRVTVPGVEDLPAQRTGVDP